MYVMDGGVMRKGASKLFHLGGHSSANKTSNMIPPKTIPHTHTGTGRYPQRTNMLLVPRRAAESSRSSVTTLRSANSSEATKKNISLTFNNFVLKQSAHRE